MNQQHTIEKLIAIINKLIVAILILVVGVIVMVYQFSQKGKDTSLAMVKIICDHVDPLKPYGFLIGEIKTKKEELKVIKIIKKQVFKK